MFVTQLSIFIENRFGRIAELTRLLADNGIDMRTISIADTKEFGIVRIIADNPDKAAEVLTADGWIFTRSRPFSSASSKACCVLMTPSWPPFSSIRRTSLSRISSLIISSVAMSMHLLHKMSDGLLTRRSEQSVWKVP